MHAYHRLFSLATKLDEVIYNMSAIMLNMKNCLFVHSHKLLLIGEFIQSCGFEMYLIIRLHSTYLYLFFLPQPQDLKTHTSVRSPLRRRANSHRANKNCPQNKSSDIFYYVPALWAPSTDKSVCLSVRPSFRSSVCPRLLVWSISSTPLAQSDS